MLLILNPYKDIASTEMNFDPYVYNDKCVQEIWSCTADSVYKI